MSEPRFTVYLDGEIPLAHRATLAEAVEVAQEEPGAGYIIERDRLYPFTKRRAYTADGVALEGMPT